ncbi:MAG: hypothetical protein K6U08_09080, partial [Firmicutes bacterium]|nr:hypothetical protein [Bacillota bacterium]
LKALEGRVVLFILRPDVLAILGQAFRPVIVAKLKEAHQDYTLLDRVNIRFSSAPQWVFPTPLYIPNDQIALFVPFGYNVFFPLTL